jgi:hypothetical protein
VARRAPTPGRNREESNAVTFTAQPYPLYVAHPGNPSAYLTDECLPPMVELGLIVGWQTTTSSSRAIGERQRPVVLPLELGGGAGLPDPGWWDEGRDNHLAPTPTQAVRLAVGSAAREMSVLAAGSPLKLAQYASVCWAAGTAEPLDSPGYPADLPDHAANTAWLWAADWLLNRIHYAAKAVAALGGIAAEGCDAEPFRVGMALDGLLVGERLRDEEHGLPEALGIAVVVDASQPDAGVLVVANCHDRPRYVTLYNPRPTKPAGTAAVGQELGEKTRQP